MLFSGSMLAQVVGFGALVFLGRWYSPESFGDLEVFLRLTGIFVAIAGLRYEMAIVVEDSDENAVDLTRLSLYLNTAVSVFLFLVALLFAKPLANLFHLQNAYVIYFIPLVIWLTASTETLVLFRNRKKEYSKISANRVITSFSSTGYKLSHFWLFTPAINGLVIGQILGQVVGFIQMTYRLPFKIFEYNKLAFSKLARKYKMFPMFSMPAALLNILATSMPFFIISALDGQTATGYFANAYKLTYLPLSMLSMSIGAVFFERIARLKGDKKESTKLSHELLTFLFFIALIPVVVFAVWGDKIAPLVLGPNWNEAGVYIQITILFYFSMFITSAFSSAFETYNKLNVQLIYNASFLILTSLAMYLSYYYGGNTRSALVWFVMVGTTLRIGVLNYFFFLFGKNILAKTIFAILITGFLIWFSFGIKEGFPF
jgi:O-antigen/teichoic acid export membrane protein